VVVTVPAVVMRRVVEAGRLGVVVAVMVVVMVVP